jgi:hypothetical protein
MSRYRHYNPLKHGLVTRALDWSYSTFHRYVRRGILPTDWAVNPGEVIGDAGEEPPCAMRTLRLLRELELREAPIPFFILVVFIRDRPNETLQRIFADRRHRRTGLFR